MFSKEIFPPDIFLTKILLIPIYRLKMRFYTFIGCHFYVQIALWASRRVHFKRDRSVGPAIFRIDTGSGHLDVVHSGRTVDHNL